MEKVKILGIDPSLRNTGLAVITYNTELSPSDPKSFQVSDCQVLINPKKYTSIDAILNMLDMMQTEAEKECYQQPETVLVESPPIMFNKNWSSSVLSNIAHVAGGAAVIFGLEKCHLFQPNQWNKSRKKEVTHNKTIAFLGSPEKWHYQSKVKDNYMEHVLDAVSMALWWIRSNYVEEEEDKQP